MQSRTCLKCRVFKTEDNFTKSSTGIINRTCFSCKEDRVYKVKGRRKEYKREWEFQRKYGISLSDYENMLVQQCGLCAVCGKEESKISPKSGEIQPLSVHHDHGTGKVIGLWCNQCNRASGYFRDDAKLMHRAAMLTEEVHSNF